MSDSVTQNPSFLTTREVADLLRVKERKVYDLAAANEIPHRRITGKLLFPAAEIRAWIDGPDQQHEEDRPNVLAGSHDPLLDWAIHASECGLATLCNGSKDGLTKFESRSAALAGIHLPEEDGWNCTSVAAKGFSGVVLVNWAIRKRGLLVTREQLGEIRSISNLHGKRVALRQPGAGATVLLSRLLEETGMRQSDLKNFDGYVHTESDAAAAVAAGEADAALGIEAMAKRFKLSFVPLLDEYFDLLIDRKSYFTEPVQRLFEFARTRDFREKAAALGGYDLSQLGFVRWLSE